MNREDRKKRRLKRRKNERKMKLIFLVIFLLLLLTIYFFVSKAGDDQKKPSNKKVESVGNSTSHITPNDNTYRETKEENTKSTNDEAEETKKEKNIIREIKNPYNTSDLSEDEIQEKIAKLPDTLKEKVERYPETLHTTLRYFDVKDKEMDQSIEKDYENAQALDRNVKLPYLSQWDERWGFDVVDGEYISISACGPTSLTMIYAGLTGDTSINPVKMAEKLHEMGFYSGETGGQYGLFLEGAKNLGLNGEDLSATEENLKQALDNKKILVALVRNYGIGDFTKGSGHYILLTEYDEDDKVTIYDANSYENTNKKWDMQRILDQTDKFYAVWK